MDSEGRSKAWGPDESASEFYGGKFNVEGFWFSPEELLKRFELIGRENLPEEPTCFQIRARKKGGEL